MSYGLQALKLIIGILTLTLTLRILGKLSFSQLTPYDVVYLIVFGGILDSTFFDDDIGIFPFLFSVSVWTLCIYLIEYSVIKSSKFRRLFRGSSDPIIENGKLNMTSFKKNNLEMEQLRSVLRKSGTYSLREVKDMFLETDGTFSINKYVEYQPVINASFNSKMKEDYPNTLLIDTGKVETEALKSIDKSLEWLQNELNALGCSDITNIIYCEWSKQDGFYIKTKSDLVSNDERVITN